MQTIPYQKYLSCSKISIDTRTLQKGDMFIAIKGTTFDGNLFVSKAFENGAKYVVIDNPKMSINANCILVENTIQALQTLAKEHRKHCTATEFIAIAGSNGKTTTKEILHRVLASKYTVQTTQGNLNNHIGLPLTILDIKPNTDIAIIEMGANHLNEHRVLCDIAMPTMGIVTNCGKDHLEGYGSIDAVIQSHKEVFDYLKTHQAKAVVNADDTVLLDLAKGLKTCTYGTHNTAQYRGAYIEKFPTITLSVTEQQQKPFNIQTKLFGAFHLYNVLAVVAIARYFNIENTSIQKHIEEYTPKNNRSEYITQHTNTILLDAYNANPTSMLPILQDFTEYPVQNKILILGDMFELGKYALQEHKSILQSISKHLFKEVILVGKTFMQHQKHFDFMFFATTEETKQYIKQQHYTNCHFLVKGSRGMQLERIFQ